MANKPTCVAQSGDLQHGDRSEQAETFGQSNNYFREAHFTADGTTVVTLSQDQSLRSFILPVNLLEQDQQPHELLPYSSYRSASTIHSYAVYPFFNTQDLATSLALVSSSSVPLTLRNALYFDTVHGSYPWIDSNTEEFLSARSLTFSRDGTRFIAGGVKSLAVFDASRDGSGPVVQTRLKYAHKAGASGLSSMLPRAPVTAMDISLDGILAVGTQTRDIGLFDSEGAATCSTVFSVAEPDSAGVRRRGTGVMHIKWSPDGRYLLIAERQCDTISVYDIRNTGVNVAQLCDRHAQTTQKLGLDVVLTADGYEVWAGGTDGHVRAWKDPGQFQGTHTPDMDFTLHESPVSSVVWHPGGSVLATCSGARRAWVEDKDGDRTDELTPIDNTLRIWTL